ncbi:hypothetical protein D6851_04505 [Altericroceibacterium spongiae]|uniref:Uncharacterized protein n=1 Tax=Altericroceibacterium spongiae TaxID=2320269 RepID=A0A420EP84_9SPHN|nr:hypothetical protein [Altericroceibacterium spongiae]RKF22489.1 hypothetical protein D6851_04505 [Altericroceibacterium spongiae]
MPFSLPISLIAPLMLMQTATGGVPGASDAPLPQGIGRDETTRQNPRRAGSSRSTIEQDRLGLCLEKARRDPTTAMVNASSWLSEAHGTERALPQQCLGMAYVSLLRWEAAEQSFLAARSARKESDHTDRARLAGMAGNAALADNRAEDALHDFDLAMAEAESAQDTPLAGGLSADRARALVLLKREDDAEAALQKAITDAPQNPRGWLLLATLERRQDKLSEAADHIRTAGGLAPQDPEVALEAGLIAVLSGDDETARKNWQAVLDLAPADSTEAANAKAYLAQLQEEDQP